MLGYNLAIRSYRALVGLAQIWDPKAKKWIQGRKNWREELAKDCPKGQARIWVHCSSLGEFEQGRPVIEGLMAENLEAEIILTFFSPSGYEVRKNYPHAKVHYLPLDTKSNAKDIITIIQPQMAVFVKYEFWLHFFTELNKNSVPLYLISGIFHPSNFMFTRFGGFVRQCLEKVSHFFVQDERSKELLKSIGIHQVTISGDTRFDRVLEIAKHAEPIQKIEHFKGNHKVFVSGSSWPIDEELLSEPLLASDWKWLIAPHHVDEQRIREIERNFPGITTRLSGEISSFETAKICIIDSIGLLSQAYQYADLVYVGGGFGEGIHNVLEPAVFGVPVAFGPNNEIFKEAQDLLQAGAGFSFTDAPTFRDWFVEMASNSSSRERIGRLAKAYVHTNSGATRKFLDFVHQNHQEIFGFKS